MLSTIIAPCLSVPQHHPPPPPPPPPLAVYIQRVRSTRLHTLKPSSTCWNSTSQKRLSVRRSYLFFFHKKKSHYLLRICCRFCCRNCRLCYGSQTGFSFPSRKVRLSSTRTHKIHHLCHKRLDKGRSDNTHSSRCSRIHRPGKASPPHRSGAMGT